MKNTTIIVIVAILIIAVAGISFAAGIKYQQTKQPQFLRQGGQLDRNQFRNNSGVRPVRGEIISSDDKSITVKMQDGSTKIVILSSTNTVINKAAQGTKDDLKTGETVMVFGTQNSDGSVTAQNIQLNPQNRLPSGSPLNQ